MQPTKRPDNDQRDMQRSRLGQVVDLEHKLANAIPAVANYNSRLLTIRPEAASGPMALLRLYGCAIRAEAGPGATPGRRAGGLFTDV